MSLTESGGTDTGVYRASRGACRVKIEFFADNHAWIESKLFAGTDADFFAIVGTRTGIEVAVGYVGIRGNGFW